MKKSKKKKAVKKSTKIAAKPVQPVLKGPSPRILLSHKNRIPKWSIALAELVDNSFDAGATQIEIDISKARRLIVSDNGNGCSDVLSMLNLGEHIHTSTTESGIYGVGLKDATCFIWGKLRVDTVFKSARSVAVMDVRKMVKQEDWSIEMFDSEPPDGSVSGTKLMFTGFTRKHASIADLLKDLGYTFQPALSIGKQIIIKGRHGKIHQVKPWQTPILSESVESKFDVCGKGVVLKLGVVAEGESNDHPGFNYAHAHRIVMNTSHGSGGKSIQNTCGIVQLSRSWELSTNKNRLADQDKRQLGDAIFAVCEELLTKIKNESSSILNSNVTSELQKMLKNIAKKPKFKRERKPDNDPTKKKGTVEATGKGPKHDGGKNKKDQDARISKIRVEDHSWKDGRLGSADIEGDVVYLNPESLRIAKLKKDNNVDALADIAMMLYTEAAFRSGEKKCVWANRNGDGTVPEGLIEALSTALNGIQE